jgi:hypothetical protein
MANDLAAALSVITVIRRVLPDVEAGDVPAQAKLYELVLDLEAYANAPFEELQMIPADERQRILVALGALWHARLAKEEVAGHRAARSAMILMIVLAAFAGFVLWALS